MELLQLVTNIVALLFLMRIIPTDAVISPTVATPIFTFGSVDLLNVIAEATINDNPETHSICP